ncbi:MAG: GNAT family N-acetyltransferase [Solirubrobacterales bacterium]|nr:GNAT family N-acetyltransferase [Solirubrobacterales bacterium]
MARARRSKVRVSVRPPTPADREAYLAAMHESRELHRPWLAAATGESFETLLRHVEDERFDPMLVCRIGDGAIVGFINISEIVRGGFQSAFLGYGGVAAYAGQGYMSEGLELVLARAFTELGLHRLEANIQPGNRASIALVQGAGFVREGFSERYLKIAGRWRDHERWAIRAEQWRARRRRRR